MKSETFSLDDVDYIPLLTKEVQDGKFKTVDPRFLDAYRRMLLREDGYTSYPEIAASLGLSGYGGIDPEFRIIKGRISELRGKLFELAILERYVLSGVVASMVPEPILQYPAGCAAEKVPDRVVILLDGRIKICSWKCLQGNNATINLGVKKRDGYLYCPEIREARRLIELGGNPDLIRVFIEGLLGRRERCSEGMFIVPEFFSIEIDPYTCDRSITIPREGRVAWPPSVFELTGIRPRATA